MFKTQPLTLLLPTLALLACDVPPDDGAPAQDLDALGAPVGKADGPEVSIGQSGAYDVLVVRGEAAQSLFQTMDEAGGLERASQNGLAYRYGSYSICVSNGAAAACNLYTRDARVDGVAPYLATTHGDRFASASSELFGAISRSQGLAPSAVDFVESGRFACGKTASEVWCGVTAPSTEGVTLELSFAGLPALGDDFVYEGWLITADGPVTSGRFALAQGQDTIDMKVDTALAAASTLFVLTIEPKFGDVPEPSSTHIVAGEFVDGQATLDTAHGAALGSDFTASMGGFILETPSTANIAEDYGQGVWFLDPAGGPGPSLDLPELPDGWVYEGWVVGADGPLSTGRFADFTQADRDGAGPTSGPDATPPFPGQDFIEPAIDLTVEHMVVVSVEPEPDDSPLPFALKPLAGKVQDAGPGKLQALGNIASSNRITGLASLN